MIGNNKSRNINHEACSLKHGTSKDRFHVSCFRMRERGFTLVELVVAIAVFATVVTVVSSIFVSSVGSQRKNINNQDVLDNARYVLETMGRAIRQSDIVTGDGPALALTITHPTKDLVTYTLENNQIKESGKSISSSNVSVQSLNFVVKGNDSGDGLQPRVTISISLKNTQSAPGVESTANLQTTITPRVLQTQ